MRRLGRQNLRCTHPRLRTSQIGKREVHHKSALHEISKIGSISAASPKVESLIIRQQKRDQALRPQLHTILRSQTGSFKSTILAEIGELYGITPYSSVTYPAMIGTIDQTTHELVPGLVWQNRKKILLLDEFKTGERGDSSAVDVLLGVMEQGYYKRKIGIKSPSKRETDETDETLFYRVDGGEIEVRTRLSAIIATMKNWDMARSGKYAALTQRCIPIRYTLDDKTIDAVLDGAPCYKHYQYNPEPHVTISKKDFLRIRKIAEEVRRNPPENTDFRSVYARTVGDLCRIYAVTRKFDSDLFELVCYLKAGLTLEKALECLKDQ